MTIQKNKVTMLEEARNKTLANGQELNEEEQAEILSLPQCNSDFEISDDE